MQVLTYVDGYLTVINGDNIYKGNRDKPTFISGKNFYYEPTQKVMDGVLLTDDLVVKVQNYIDNFAFLTNVVNKSSVHCVDVDGNYLGLVMSTDSYIEVSSPPTGDNDKWINGEWVECCLIDKTSKKYIGIGDNRTSANTEYAPNTLLPEPFEASKYAWNGISWEISLEDAKVCKKTGLRRKQSTEINLTLGDIANLEVMSFTTQESEARKWLVDNTANTPFVDGLLNARANGETKQDLCNKILFKADAYATIYSAQLGRFHKLIKAVDLAMSVKEVKAVVWN